MSELERICREVAGLPDKDIERLLKIESVLQYMADLAGADVFIDCFYDNGNKCIVAAGARPCGDLSLYDRSVVGEDADIKNEPAVFAVRNTGLPVRDLMSTTQENKLVRQDVIPIRNDEGDVYAVLIREKDVSESVRQDRKYMQLASTVQEMSERIHMLEASAGPHSDAKNQIARKEIHHRIKNNLQMVASILNMQSRRSTTAEMRDAFKENVKRVLSFAAIHEILNKEGFDEKLSILELLEKVRQHTIIYSNHEEKKLAINVEGDDFLISDETAASAALVVNELLSNSVKHAFTGRAEGKITVKVIRGSRYGTVAVTDNGNGFSPQEGTLKSMGLSIVEATVREKLDGELQILSNGSGSTIQFSFKTEDF